MDVVLTTNSPGEVAAWLVPAAKALRKRMPAARITVFVPPCNFASGSECAVVAGVPEVDQVFGPRQFVQLVALGRRPRQFSPAAQGVVCFLGGDLLFTAWLARRLRYPALAYTEGRARRDAVYRRFMVPGRRAKEKVLQQGVEEERVEVVGNLMLDAVSPLSANKKAARRLLHLPDDALVLALFPGSRPSEFRLVFPLFVAVAELLADSFDRRLCMVLSLSPFIQPGQLSDLAEGVAAVSGITGEPALRGWRLELANTEIVAYQGVQYDVMLAADLALTIPGSNTAEMAALGLPHVVALPLNRPQDIPLEGLPGVIGGLPLVGPAVKKAAVRQLATRVRFTALPNREANRMLVPEVRGVISPPDVAGVVQEMLEDEPRRQQLSAALKELMGPAGAADRLALAVESVATGGVV